MTSRTYEIRSSSVSRGRCSRSLFLSRRYVPSVTVTIALILRVTFILKTCDCVIASALMIRPVERSGISICAVREVIAKGPGAGSGGAALLLEGGRRG